jgi:hypothetical protein
VQRATAQSKTGKSAIYMGGALQLHFGIRGVLWEGNPGIAALVNDAWTWPSDEETQGGNLKVGGYFK